jgi:hypothetical protein
MRELGRRSYIEHEARGWLGVHGTDAEGEAAADASRVCHGHQRSWEPGPGWAFEGQWLGQVDWIGSAGLWACRGSWSVFG